MLQKLTGLVSIKVLYVELSVAL